MKARMFEVKINLGNEAMRSPLNVKHSLLELAEKMDQLEGLEGEYGNIRDSNGNLVGSWRVR